MALFRWVWEGLKWLVKLVLPVFAKARDFRGMPAALRWFLHLLLLGLILAGLAVANFYSPVRSALPTVGVAIQKYLFFPLLFLLVYILSWLGWWLWKLLGAEEGEGAFPDIDAAWDEAVAALHKAGIDVTEAPLFLILGRPLTSEDTLMSASQVPLTVRRAPARAEAPVHVYANRDAIYVSCAGASLLGRQAALLAGERDTSADNGAPSAGEFADIDPGKTLRPDEKDEMRQMQDLLARAEREGRSPAQLLEEERRELRVLTRKAAPPPALLRDTAQVDHLLARLRHVCRLIARDRRPYCPVNGLLLLVPFLAADDDALADQTGTICQKEVAAARQALEINCPLFALIADMEKAPGFRDFVLRFAEGERQRRVGQRFPLLPDIDETTLSGKIEESVGWIGQAVIPYWVYRLFRVEGPGQEDAATVIRANAQIYQFMSEMRARQKRFGRIISRAAPADRGGLTLFGGSYLAGTGADSVEQAFVPGFFRRLIESQNAVSWTAEALAEETEALRWARYGYVALAALVAAAVAAGVYFYRQGGST